MDISENKELLEYLKIQEAPLLVYFNNNKKPEYFSGKFNSYELANFARRKVHKYSLLKISNEKDFERLKTRNKYFFVKI